MEPGTKIRYTADKLGVMVDPNDSRFIGTLGRDFTGTYVGPHDNPRLEQWHITKVPARCVEPGNEASIDEMERLGPDHEYFVVVYEGTFEAV